MALTDADRMQMALMAVMRHNVVTIQASGAGDLIVYDFGPTVVTALPGEILSVFDFFEVVSITSTENINDYIIT